MMNLSTVCQSCRSAPAQTDVKDEEGYPPYRVCRACERRLLSYSLRPLEWFNLAALHGSGRFLLHDDFYDTTPDNYGVADQPEEAVEEAERFPAPKLEEIKGDLERVVDYAMTLYWLAGRPDVVEALSQLPKEAVLVSVKERVATSAPNRDIEAISLSVCACCLGPVAAEWVREQWRQEPFPSLLFHSLADAAAHCLPFEEAWGLVMDRLAIQSHDVGVLASFRSPRVLDWMEQNKIGAKTDQWGHVAALCHCTWARAASWLEQGRPLSHVALATIQACQNHDTPLSRLLKPVLEDPAPVQTMIDTLNDYVARDPVPNVRKRAASIIEAWEQDSGKNALQS